MNLLDMRTVLFSYIITNALCVAVIATLWRQNRRIPALAFWLADFSMQFIGVLLLTLRGMLPDILTLILSNALIIGGTLLLLIGLEQYTGKTGPQWHNYLYMGMFVFIHLYFVFIQPSILARTINISLGILIFCSQCAWLLFQRVDPSMRQDTWRTGVVLLVFSIVSLIRIFVDLKFPPETNFFPIRPV